MVTPPVFLKKCVNLADMQKKARLLLDYGSVCGLGYMYEICFYRLYQRGKQTMRTLQRVETILGISAAVLGLLTLAYILFGPLYTGTSSSTGGLEQVTTASLLQVGVSTETAVILCILALAFLGVAAGAILHSRTGQRRWSILLWVAVIPIGGLTILGIASIGLLLLPATIGALATAMFSFGIVVTSN